MIETPSTINELEPYKQTLLDTCHDFIDNVICPIQCIYLTCKYNDEHYNLKWEQHNTWQRLVQLLNPINNYVNSYYPQIDARAKSQHRLDSKKREKIMRQIYDINYTIVTENTVEEVNMIQANYCASERVIEYENSLKKQALIPEHLAKVFNYAGLVNTTCCVLAELPKAYYNYLPAWNLHHQMPNLPATFHECNLCR